MHPLRYCFLLLFVGLFGCATTYLDEIGMASSGRTINLGRGDSLTVALGANLTNGGDWELVSLDQSVVKLTKEYKPEALVATGGLARLYQFKYNFKAVSKGETTLQMEQNDPNSETPVQTFTLHFVVE